MIKLPEDLWRYHWQPAGFIQVIIRGYRDVGDGVEKGRERFHLWSDRWNPTRESVSIHDHRFWFDSTVLLGTLHGVEYAAEMNPAGDHSLWQVRTGLVGNIDLIKVREYVVETGETYSFGGQNIFHDHLYTGPLITHLKETGRIHCHNRYILPKDEHRSVRSDDDLAPSEREMRDEAARMLKDAGLV